MSVSGGAEAGVRAAAEAEVAGQRQQLDLREMRAHELRAAIGGSVVDHDDFVAGIARQRRRSPRADTFPAGRGRSSWGSRRVAAARGRAGSGAAEIGRRASPRTHQASQSKIGQRQRQRAQRPPATAKAAAAAARADSRFRKSMSTGGELRAEPDLAAQPHPARRRYSASCAASAAASSSSQAQRPGGALFQLRLGAVQPVDGPLVSAICSSQRVLGVARPLAILAADVRAPAPATSLFEPSAICACALSCSRASSCCSSSMRARALVQFAVERFGPLIAPLQLLHQSPRCWRSQFLQILLRSSPASRSSGASSRFEQRRCGVRARAARWPARGT